MTRAPMTRAGRAWRSVLSALLLAAALALAVARPAALDGRTGLAFVSLLVFASVAPWLGPHAGDRAWGALAAAFALSSALLAWHTVHDAFPRACSGRQAPWCRLGNLLHDVGGPVLAALPWALVALAFALGAVVLLRPSRR